MSDWERLTELRKKINYAIGLHLAQDAHCKSYEGAMQITYSFPNYFEDPTGKKPHFMVTLALDCYVLGPNRHYTWTSSTLNKVLDVAELTINEWLKEEERWRMNESG